jgi:preprotein translocase subunit SecA
MFVDLMSDVHHTFAERFLRVQLEFGEPPQELSREPEPAPVAPPRRFNALGMVEEAEVMDVGPDEAPKTTSAVRAEPTVVGAGRPRSLSGEAAGPTDWSSVGRNDPCPCGSGKKFKKCHGVGA